MGIKEQLDKIRESAKVRRSIIWNLERLTGEIDTIRDAGQRVLTADGVVSHNETSNPTQDKAIKIVDGYGEKLDEMLSDLSDLDYKIDEVRKIIKGAYMDEILNPNEKNVLIYFYIEGMSLSEVAMAMDYSQDWIQEMKGNAVKGLGETIKE